MTHASARPESINRPNRHRPEGSKTSAPPLTGRITEAIILVCLAFASPAIGQIPTCQPPIAPWPAVPVTPLPDDPTTADLQTWNTWMASLGPRQTGNYAHQRLIAEIQTQLSALNLPLQIWTQAFTRWEQQTSSLTVGGTPYTPAGYVPYSAFTPPGGLDAEIVYGGKVKTKSTFDRFIHKYFKFLEGESYRFKRAHRDKIVAIDVPLGKLSKTVLKKIIDRRYPRRLFKDDWRSYSRAIFLEEQTPSLEQAHLAGARAVVLMLGMSTDNAQQQYLPFTRPLGPVPGLHLDHRQGVNLKTRLRAAGGSLPANLTLRGCQESVTTPHLIYTLKGQLELQRDAAGRAWDPMIDEQDVVVVLTHTDGSSAVEENGVLALMSLARRFAAKPLAQRRHTLIFAFVTGHFAHDVGSADDFVRHFPELIDRANAAVVIEHLGSKEMVDDLENDDYDEVGGRPETALLFTTRNHPLGDRTWESLREHDIQRMLRIPATRKLFKSLGRDFFGEGLFLNNAKIPTVGYLANPNYLASAAFGGHIARVDWDRMQQEICAFRHLLDYLVDRAPAGVWPDLPNPPACGGP